MPAALTPSPEGARLSEVDADWGGKNALKQRSSCRGHLYQRGSRLVACDTSRNPPRRQSRRARHQSPTRATGSGRPGRGVVGAGRATATGRTRPTLTSGFEPAGRRDQHAAPLPRPSGARPAGAIFSRAGAVLRTMRQHLRRLVQHLDGHDRAGLRRRGNRLRPGHRHRHRRSAGTISHGHSAIASAPRRLRCGAMALPDLAIRRDRRDPAA
jgi:hypothetical protein